MTEQDFSKNKKFLVQLFLYNAQPLIILYTTLKKTVCKGYFIFQFVLNETNEIENQLLTHRN